MKYFLPITLLIIALHINTASAETMSGGGYTLNGGLDVFSGQGSGGGYTLNPYGDPLSLGSTGGGYTLQATPYSSGSAAAEGQVLSSVASSYGSWGTTVDVTAIQATTTEGSGGGSTTTTQTTTRNPGGVNESDSSSQGPRGFGQTGEDYSYPNGGFGHGTTTLDQLEEVVNTPAGWSILFVIILACLIILLRAALNYRKTSQ